MSSFLDLNVIKKMVEILERHCINYFNMVSNGLMRNVLHIFWCMNTWYPTGGTSWNSLGDVTRLEDLCQLQLDVLKPFPIPIPAPLLYACGSDCESSASRSCHHILLCHHVL